MDSCGKLTLITGPMWSGKTTELLRLFDRRSRASLNCLLVKHSVDDRYSNDYVSTHIGYKIPAQSCNSITHLMKQVDVTKYNGIFIDEIQFFTDKKLCLKILEAGVDVVVAGLNGDWKQQIFPDMDVLFSNASDIRLLTAICGICRKQEACLTVKKVGDNKQIAVGGSETYIPSCLGCKILEKY